MSKCLTIGSRSFPKTRSRSRTCEAARGARPIAEIAPDADEIKIKVLKKVVFFDCGANLERIGCPSCHEEIEDAWWQERMDEDNNGGYQLKKYAAPCCGAEVALHELEYEWPQAFGRFAIEAMNANIGKLKDKQKRELEKILGTKVRVVYQHI